MRTYLFRLPLFTRLMLLAIFGLWLLELQTVWSVIEWGALIPNEVGFGSMYRLNTYPLVHNGFLHMVMDVVCLAPLLERFEAEWGTFNCVALFLGRKCENISFVGVLGWVFFRGMCQRGGMTEKKTGTVSGAPCSVVG